MTGSRIRYQTAGKTALATRKRNAIQAIVSAVPFANDAGSYYMDTDHGVTGICDASQNESYLRDAVPCIHDECEVGEFRMQVALLGPLQITCKAAGNPIPSPILSSAYAAIASATATGEASKTSSDAGYATKPTPHQSAKSSSTVSTRKSDTSSLETRPTASSAPSSALASPSSSGGASAPAAPTPEQNAPSAGPSTTLSTTSPSNQDIQEDGQLLSNTNEAGPSHRAFSLSATLLVVAAGILLQS